MTLNGLPGSTTTDDLGYYQADVESGWSGTVTPQKLDDSFTPVFRSYSSLMLTMKNQDYSGTAPSQTLTVVLAGDGSGVVTGDGGLNCGLVCTAAFEKYTTVDFSTIPDFGSIFSAAEGAECTDSGECSLTITGDTTVTVSFDLELIPPTPTPPANVIPEPATIVLIGLGLLGLLGPGLRKRRKRK